jgi:hypothetical protein
MGFYELDLVQDKNERRVLANTVMQLRVPKLVSSCATGGLSRRVELHGVS